MHISISLGQVHLSHAIMCGYLVACTDIQAQDRVGAVYTYIASWRGGDFYCLDHLLINSPLHSQYQAGKLLVLIGSYTCCDDRS